ncbi:MAG: phenylacetic acid degradation protein paaN [Bacteroidia bacterium]|jgi:phenylacetic acid degradation protein paaN|tara:strand:- start:3024 stop:4667 length:1644 start_codon:yes stop_codon:yes gene_type:complete
MDQSALYLQHEERLNQAIEALSTRQFFSPYPEHPKAYDLELDAKGKDAFGRLLNENFTQLNQESDAWVGEEVSPLWQYGIGVRYPSISPEKYISNSITAAKDWKKVSIETRAAILIESLERVRGRFFELAYATMHTTGQSFMMAFQASGPHAADRALEAIAMGVQELTRYPKELAFSKPLGKYSLDVQKSWKPIPKGVGLVIGCSTFPTWNTVPGVYANLICGNTAIIKPHPKSILAIAIFLAELRKVLVEQGFDANVVQLAADTLANPITVALAEDPEVKLIDYTGGNSFGDYVETLNKTVFTEKSGINSVIVDSVNDIKAVAQNIAFSVSLYSGQMCTAPQNIFIPEEVKTADGVLSFDEVAAHIVEAVKGVITHPKMGAGTLGNVQNDATIKRISQLQGNVLLAPQKVENPEALNARIQSPTLMATEASAIIYREECFGPLVFLVKTENTVESVAVASTLSVEKGAITCLAFSTDVDTQEFIEEQMNEVFVPVSFNMSGGGFVNQHAAFSDFHVTGGNAAGNATFADASFINRRFVWVGNRRMG